MLSRRCRRPWPLVLLVLTGLVVRAEDTIESSPRLPDSLPWHVQELSKPPAHEWVDQSGTVHSLLFAGEPYNGHETQVFAYYASPSTLGMPGFGSDPLPGVVLIHGGGGTAFREWAELWAKRGYAAIAMDLAGYRPLEGKNPHQRENRTRLAAPGPDQGVAEKFEAVDQPVTQQWPYHAVAAAIRAHSLIRSFPEVDRNRTAVTGISWGGYLTCIVAGVDTRFRAAVPVYGCGFLQENSAWLDQFATMTDTQRERWQTLWDPSQYLPAVSMPILFVNGTNDFAYPLDSYMKSYRAVPGAKAIRITVNMPHSHPAGWAPQEIGLFIDQYLREGTPLPTISAPRIEGARLSAVCASEKGLQKAALHFTTDDGTINQRTWQTLPAQIREGVVSVPAPPAEATAWFLTVTDHRGAVVSSPVELP